MFKYKYKIFFIWGFLFLISAFITINTVQNEKKYTEQNRTEFPNIKRDSLYIGQIQKMEKNRTRFNKGTTYISLVSGKKFMIYEVSVNYSYAKYILTNFLQVGDSIFKKAQNDTIRIYRDNQEYFFVLNKEINKNEKK